MREWDSRHPHAYLLPQGTSISETTLGWSWELRLRLPYGLGVPRSWTITAAPGMRFSGDLKWTGRPRCGPQTLKHGREVCEPLCWNACIVVCWDLCVELISVHLSHIVLQNWKVSPHVFSLIQFLIQQHVQKWHKSSRTKEIDCYHFLNMPEVSREFMSRCMSGNLTALPKPQFPHVSIRTTSEGFMVFWRPQRPRKAFHSWQGLCISVSRESH